MDLSAILALGFVLGMRHATDADHVVAVSTIVSREKSILAAAPIGVLWGLGHSLTILIVGTAIVVFGIVIPPHAGLALELAVAIMLVVLGALNLHSTIHQRQANLGPPVEVHAPHVVDLAFSAVPTSRVRGAGLRPFAVGVVHGLAGSAAIALLALGSIHDSLSAIGYLGVFCFGTVAGMLLVTTGLGMPIAIAAGRFDRLHRSLGAITGMASMAVGARLFYEVAFVDAFFTTHPHWMAH